MFGAQSIMLGLNDVVVVGGGFVSSGGIPKIHFVTYVSLLGMESMSRAPHYIDGMRLGPRLGHSELTDSLLKVCTW